MIHKIVLTGGPCGGKTTALPILTEHFKKKKLNVYTVPEIATLFHMNGVDLLHHVKHHSFQLEHAIFQAQMVLEDSVDKLAQLMDNDSIILCDRGLGDFRAYASPEDWELLLIGHRFTQDDIHKRYHRVVHLTTAAIGAEKYFTNENNPARNCPPDMARHLDRKTLEAWKGHPKLVEIDNSTDFDGKMAKAIMAIEKTIEGRKM